MDSNWTLPTAVTSMWVIDVTRFPGTHVTPWHNLESIQWNLFILVSKILYVLFIKSFEVPYRNIQTRVQDECLHPDTELPRICKWDIKQQRLNTHIPNQFSTKDFTRNYQWNINQVKYASQYRQRLILSFPHDLLMSLISIAYKIPLLLQWYHPSGSTAKKSD